MSDRITHVLLVGTNCAEVTYLDGSVLTCMRTPDTGEWHAWIIEKDGIESMPPTRTMPSSALAAISREEFRRNPELLTAARELVADASNLSDRMEEEDADAFVVVVIDTESQRVSGVYGSWPTSHQALVKAGLMDADPLTGTNPTDGEAGWKHVVAPFYAEKETR